MRTILISAIVIIALAAIGWITFSQYDDKASVNIETERIQDDTAEMVEAGKELASDIGEGIENMTDDAVEEADEAVETQDALERESAEEVTP